MSRVKDACPYEPQVRAERCETCCEVSGGLTPCVAAWLRAGALVLPSNVIELPLQQRKAA